MAGLGTASAEVRRVKQRRTAGVQLADKDIEEAGIVGLNRIHEWEIRRTGFTRKVNVSVDGIDRNAPSSVTLRAAEIGRVDKRSAIEVHFAHEGITVTARCQLQW